LALGITAAAVGVLWAGAVQPILGMYADGAETLRQRRVLAEHMADVAATQPLLKQRASSLQASGPPTVAALEGASDALAAATLQSLVGVMADEANVRLVSSETLPAEPAGAWRRIALRLTVDAAWPALVQFMRATESATPRMFVDDLQLRAQPTVRRNREPALDISLTIEAFRAAGDKS
jgi:general secretion pathway protein M